MHSLARGLTKDQFWTLSGHSALWYCKAIVDTLNHEINPGLADPGLNKRLVDLGGEVSPNSPDDFRRFIAAETEKRAKVLKFAGIKPE